MLSPLGAKANIQIELARRIFAERENKCSQIRRIITFFQDGKNDGLKQNFVTAAW
jgi:citrate lyase beta subunit